MDYFLISAFIIIATTAFYMLLFKCYPSKKDINIEKIKLVRNRIFV
jgi:hypothetical protein